MEVNTKLRYQVHLGSWNTHKWLPVLCKLGRHMIRTRIYILEASPQIDVSKYYTTTIDSHEI